VTYEPVLVIALALLLDNALGEARRFHPLAGFGNAALLIEKLLNVDGGKGLKFRGVLALFMLLLPVLLLCLLLYSFFFSAWQTVLMDIVILYFAIGRKSLYQHALNVAEALEQNDLEKARQKISLIVSRDTGNLSQVKILTASLETLIENSSDAIFAAIVWYLLAGAPGVLIYRMVNTLDAMWGYKNSRYLSFGWAAAKLDDILNWLPARLTVLSFAVLSGFNRVWSMAFQQGMQCSSKNAGPVMAAGACALNIKLGGAAEYDGLTINKPELGCGHSPQAVDIKRGISLIDNSLILWLVLLFSVVVMIEVF